MPYYTSMLDVRCSGSPGLNFCIHLALYAPESDANVHATTAVPPQQYKVTKCVVEPGGSCQFVAVCLTSFATVDSWPTQGCERASPQQTVHSAELQGRCTVQLHRASMSRPRAFSSLPALLLLSLIAFQAASASRIKPQSTPQSTQTKTAVPSRANLAANSKDDLQEPEEPVYGIHEVPEGIVHVPEYDVREPGPSNRPHGSKQRPEDPDGYHTERPPSDAYNKHDGDDSPRDGDAYEKDKSPYDGPGQKPYDGPKEDGYGEATPQVPEAPCPKAMSADAVEDGECLSVCLHATKPMPQLLPWSVC